MRYLYEGLCTFLLIFFTSELTGVALQRGLLMLFVYMFGGYSTPAITANLALTLSFFVTGYRKAAELLSALAMQLVAVGLAQLALLAAGVSRVSPPNSLGFFQVLAAELVATFLLALAYYAMAVDVRNEKNSAGGFAFAAVAAAVSLAFPALPAGNFLVALAGLNDVALLCAAVVGEITGAVLGGQVYKKLMCANQEIAADHEELPVNFD